jgi:hypothetical protein
MLDNWTINKVQAALRVSWLEVAAKNSLRQLCHAWCTCYLTKYVADVTRASKSSLAGVSSKLSLSKWDACWWVTTNGTQYPSEAIRCNKKLKEWWTALWFRGLYSSNASGIDGRSMIYVFTHPLILLSQTFCKTSVIPPETSWAPQIVHHV